MPESSATPFSGIFVSYRRDDSSGHAGRLFDKLANHFGSDRIFMDIDNIEPGQDFTTVIENAVGSCEVLIAIIGPHWLESVAEAPGKSHRPIDYVRLEIATALSRNIRVIPVLVHGATMPQPQDLPDELAKLSRRQAIVLSDSYFRDDVDRLISVLEGTVKGPTRKQHRLLYASLGALIIAALLGGLYAYLNGRNRRITDALISRMNEPVNKSSESAPTNVPLPTASPPVIKDPEPKGGKTGVPKAIADLKAEKERLERAIALLEGSERQNKAQRALVNQTPVP